MKNNFVCSLSILNVLNRNYAAMHKSMLRIATGRKINSVADDPSGWAIGQRMSVEIRCLDQARQNAQNSQSMMKVADGALSSTNQSLAEDTTFSTKLTDLQSRAGQDLNIQDTDKVSVSYVKDGKTCTTSFDAKDKTLGDIFKEANKLNNNAGVFEAANLDSADTTNVIGTDANGNEVKTASGKNGITVQAKDKGLDGALGGFTISVTDSQGNVKKTVNAVLDDFTETIEARNGCGDNALYTQTGTKANQGIKLGIGNMTAYGLGLKGSDGSVLSVGTQEAANAAINVLDNALNKALGQSTTIGAVSSRMDYTISNLTTQSENLTSAMSVIMDADMAKEIMEYARNSILVQAAQAMLAQSNQNAAWFLSLLK